MGLGLAGTSHGFFLHHIVAVVMFGTDQATQIGTRSSVRTRYRIKGGGCGDCMASWCCMPCELTQESREMELEEQSMRVRFS